jgi:hypothetical protein
MVAILLVMCTALCRWASVTAAAWLPVARARSLLPAYLRMGGIVPATLVSGLWLPPGSRPPRSRPPREASRTAWWRSAPRSFLAELGREGYTRLRHHSGDERPLASAVSRYCQLLDATSP